MSCSIHKFHILTLARMSTLCSILFICLSSSAVNLFSRGSSWPICSCKTLSIKSFSVCFPCDKCTTYISKQQTEQKLGGKGGEQRAVSLASACVSAGLLTAAMSYIIVQTENMILHQQVIILWEKINFLCTRLPQRRRPSSDKCKLLNCFLLLLVIHIHYCTLLHLHSIIIRNAASLLEMLKIV